MIHPWAGTQVPSVPWRGGGGSLPPARERVCGRVSVVWLCMSSCGFLGVCVRMCV